MGLNLTPGVSGGFGRGGNHIAINAVGPNAPSSVQFGFQGNSASPSVAQMGGGQFLG